MDDQKRTEILEQHLSNKQDVLSNDPKIDELFNHCTLRRPKKWLRNKRLYKKFIKKWTKYVPIRIRKEFASKIMAKSASEWIKHTMERKSIARRILKIKKAN